MKDTCCIEAFIFGLHRMIFAVMNTTLAVVKLKPPKKMIGLYRS